MTGGGGGGRAGAGAAARWRAFGIASLAAALALGALLVLDRTEAPPELAFEATDVWDLFPDPDVGRVLLPDLEAHETGRIRVTSNRFGVREREWAEPKPEVRTRVVLLGDSYVFGNGVGAEDRMGVFLEAALSERATPPPDVECLHVGMTDWNVLAAATFLRRQLGRLEPDLVVHVLIYNDLDDASAARGFGAMASFSTQQPEQADQLFSLRTPHVLGPGGRSLLTAGLDAESRDRYAEARSAIESLAAAVERRGGRYLALSYWVRFPAVARESLLAGLRDDQVAYVSSGLHERPEYRVSPRDAHWNRAGHELVAQLLYGTIRERGLLEGLELAPWDAAATAVETLGVPGREEAHAPTDPATVLGDQEVRPRLDFRELDETAAAQVHGGFDARGNVGPSAALVLANPAARTLAVEGSFLERDEIAGASVRVRLDEVEVGRLEVRPGEAIAAELPVPDRLRGRPHLSVRFDASDWAYLGDDLRQCVAFRCERVELRP